MVIILKIQQTNMLEEIIIITQQNENNYSLVSICTSGNYFRQMFVNKFYHEENK